MRLVLTLIVFVMASVVVAGSLVVLALSVPDLGLGELSTFGWVALAGFALALPVSYVIGGMIDTRLKG